MARDRQTCASLINPPCATSAGLTLRDDVARIWIVWHSLCHKPSARRRCRAKCLACFLIRWTAKLSTSGVADECLRSAFRAGAVTITELGKGASIFAAAEAPIAAVARFWIVAGYVGTLADILHVPRSSCTGRLCRPDDATRRWLAIDRHILHHHASAAHRFHAECGAASRCVGSTFVRHTERGLHPLRAAGRN